MVPKNDAKNTKVLRKIQDIFQILVKKQQILQDFGKKFKKNNFLPKRKFGSVAPVKQGFLFFMALSTNRKSPTIFVNLVMIGV